MGWTLRKAVPVVDMSDELPMTPTRELVLNTRVAAMRAWLV
jgi:hypothetical protein